MIKFKTIPEIELFDNYKNSIGNFVIRMIINDVLFDKNGATPSGFYYYINEQGEEIVLAKIKNSSFSIQEMRYVEDNMQLPDFDNRNLDKALFQRTIEFAFVKLKMEAGRNFGTHDTDWVIDEETTEILRTNKIEEKQIKKI